MNSSENWELKVDDTVYRQLQKFPGPYRKRIIKFFSSDPYAGDIQKIRGEENVWRKRVGKYRIFYEIDKSNKIIHVFWVERRTSATY